MNGKKNSARRNHNLNLQRVKRVFRMALARKVCPVCGDAAAEDFCATCGTIMAMSAVEEAETNE
jgi:rRNA maturation endonuclease Nob1